jgi:hypothetical protein
MRMRSDHFKDEWPAAYHHAMKKRGILKIKNRMMAGPTEAAPASVPGGSGEDTSPLWTGLVHLVAVRNPVSRAASALHYKYWGWKRSVYGECQRRSMDLSACLQAGFRLKETGQWEASLWTPHQASVMRDQVLGNYMVDHFALGGDLAAAKDTLQFFSLVVDLEYAEQSSVLIKCVLGWRDASESVRWHGNQNRNSSSSRAKNFLVDMDGPTKEMFLSYIVNDTLLYSHTRGLMQKHYDAAVKEINT